jgi:hypothetical protein
MIIMTLDVAPLTVMVPLVVVVPLHLTPTLRPSPFRLTDSLTDRTDNATFISHATPFSATSSYGSYEHTFPSFPLLFQMTRKKTKEDPKKTKTPLTVTKKKPAPSTRKNRKLTALRGELASTLAELVLTRAHLAYYVRRFGPRNKGSYRCAGSLYSGCKNLVPTSGDCCSPCREEANETDTTDEGDDDDVGSTVVVPERKPPGGNGSAPSLAISVV